MEREPGDQRRASLRASDADREQLVETLRQHHADGRLTLEELTERTGRAYTARTLGDLDALATDLPPLHPPAGSGEAATAPAGPAQPPAATARQAAARAALLQVAAVERPAERGAAGRLGDERPRLLLADLAHPRFRAVPRLAGLQPLRPPGPGPEPPPRP